MRKGSVLALAVLLMSVLALALGAQVASAIGEGFGDDFSGSILYSGWTFVNPAGGGSYSLSSNPGWLRITSPPDYDLGGGNNNAPRVMQTVTGDFDAFTKVTGDFSTEVRRAGLLFYTDATHFVRVERMESQKVRILINNGGTLQYTDYTLASNLNPTYLKLEKEGVNVEGYWSSDGINWNLFGFYPFSGSGTTYIGLFAMKPASGGGSFYADFDYFTISPQLFVVPEYPIGTLAIPIAMAAAFVTYRHKPWTKKTKPALP